MNANLPHKILGASAKKTLNYLYSLPYQQLVAQLKNPHLYTSGQLLDKTEDRKFQLFKFALFHNSHELYGLSALYTNTDDISHYWLRQQAFSYIHYSSKLSSLYEQNLVDYYQLINKLFEQCSNQMDYILFMQTLNCQPSSVLLDIFTTNIDIFQKRNIKQIYTKMVHIWANSSDFTEASRYHSLRLFPIQLFNISDQSLIRPVIQQTNFIERLPLSPPINLNNQTIRHNLANIQRSLVWLNRFNLGMFEKVHNRIYQSLINILKNVQQINKNKDQMSLSEYGRSLLIASNCIYIISRKILNLRAKPNLLNLIKKICKLIINTLPPIETAQQLNDVINQIKECYKVTEQKLIVDLQNLQNRIDGDQRIRYRKITNNGFQIYTKIIRLHLILVNISENTDQDIYKKAKHFFTFQNIQQFIKDSIFIGDICAQIVYALIKSIQISKNSQQWLILQNNKLYIQLLQTSKQFNQVIIKFKDINQNRQFKINQTNDFQSKLLDHNAYNNSLKLYQSNKKTNIQDALIYSLLSDNQFITYYLQNNQFITQLIKLLDREDPRIQIVPNNLYPFYCNFQIKESSCDSSYSYVWVNNRLVNKNRIADMNIWKSLQQKSLNKVNRNNSTNEIVIDAHRPNQCYDRIREQINKIIKQK